MITVQNRSEGNIYSLALYITILACRKIMFFIATEDYTRYITLFKYLQLFLFHATTFSLYLEVAHCNGLDIWKLENTVQVIQNWHHFITCMRIGKKSLALWISTYDMFNLSLRKVKMSLAYASILIGHPRKSENMT